MEDRREIARHHRWKPGHNPRDEDAIPESPYVYARIEEAPTEPVQLWTPAPGPESGVPCYNCGEMTRIVDAKTPREMLDPAFDGVPSNLTTEKILALACWKCEAVTQVRESLLPLLRRSSGGSGS